MNLHEQERTEDLPLTWAIITFVQKDTIGNSTWIRAIPNRLPQNERNLWIVGLEGGLTDSRREIRWSIRIDLDEDGFHVNTEKAWKRLNQNQWEGENWRVQKDCLDPPAFYKRVRQSFYNRTGYYDEGRSHETSANILKGMFIGGTYVDDV
ncbi:hypothetical protein BDV32DRAFT_148772 [Aspergillus pseudonomiae]|uniref:Uncharacterized protein n=1 Tax=Aspergillus pseudonomiae TaxID=1506151 RepID=A0A5N7CV51_9EURO|nr:uncharacterized protein BDV37DRAFT_288842 [Aspergillus pseudonomiae]KAB8261214.1 hypothetical protein BDV32DRAFT_148772 [Aspergillus pseudonomiae]KAE8398062.1 hypothetical protein BDV37DRAFT_288842 [Aspergillus pseudonomiae]